MTILFLSTHNLATNPRLLKEIKLAINQGFDVSLICFEFNNWSKTINDEIKKELNGIELLCIPAERKPLFQWLVMVTGEYVFRTLGKLIPLKTSFLSQAVSRRSWVLIKALNKVAKPDWVIGHNPGALYATLKAAQKFNCKAGFDVEDYHPGEGHDIYQQKLIKILMQRVLPEMDYVSFASEPIRAEIKKDLGGEGKNWITLLNYFPADEFTTPATIEGPLKLVWFSQNISAGRGLEMILPGIKKMAGEMELHLFGNIDNEFYEKEIENSENVIIHEPLPQKELHKRLSQFDVGLALEPSKDKNNELAISNKIVAYMQSGLYVLATKTIAQEAYMNNFRGHGLVFESTIEEAAIALQSALNNIKEIRANNKQRYHYCKQFDWEREAGSLLKTW